MALKYDLENKLHEFENHITSFYAIYLSLVPYYTVG